KSATTPAVSATPATPATPGDKGPATPAVPAKPAEPAKPAAKNSLERPPRSPGRHPNGWCPGRFRGRRSGLAASARSAMLESVMGGMRFSNVGKSLVFGLMAGVLLALTPLPLSAGWLEESGLSFIDAPKAGDVATSVLSHLD